MQDFSGVVKKFLGSKWYIPRYGYVLMAILLVAFDLRIQAVVNTVVDTPVRADAREYVLYAHNLQNYGVYSRTNTFVTGEQAIPVPDAKRTPLFPLFIALFLDKPPTMDNISTITRVQAVISTITVLLVFLIACQFLPTPFALMASALTAISPHLVTMNIYLLSETLFTFLVVLTMLLITKSAKNSGHTIRILAGLALGAAGLTHPMLLYFIVPLLIFLLYSWGWNPGWKKVGVIFVGFIILYGAWIGRNITTLGVPGDNTLMLAALRTGIYVDMMYQNDPRSYGYPYRFDPRFEDTSRDISSVTTEIGDRFMESPVEQLRWYLIGKPFTLWSWSNIEGPGDVFVYPVASTPYRYLPQFKATHLFMHAAHWVLVILMVGGIIVAWISPRLSGFSENTVFVARAVSILLLYHLSIMIIGFPLPRYAIPMRPFLHIMAMVPLALVAKRLLEMRFVPLGKS
ncbi:MAG: glycosyltransferase family 39 protein [Sulfuricaulis sp.]|uniref:glycosyltransferase family 39 protein n=1 Tax=Sulfuricaulis sp. TaxID=2003553 RepID=UPI0034A1E05B